MTLEIIESIIEDKDLSYLVTTNQQAISIQTDNVHQCCKDFGLITTEDQLKDFIGAELISIELIDTNYKNHSLTKNYSNSYGTDFDGNGENYNFCFIDLNTSKGKLQFALYNSVGYGYKVSIISNQLKYESVL